MVRGGEVGHPCHMSAAASRLAGLALPPADRPPGRRGLRGALALALLAGGVLALFADRYASSGSSGTGSDADIAGAHFSYTFAGPDWLHVAAPFLAGALTAAALGLWVAGRPATLAATVLMSVLSAAGFAFAAEARLGGASISARSARAVPLGLNRAGLRDQLGTERGTGSWRQGGRKLPCLVYGSTGTDEDSGDYGFCFEGDRLAVKTP